MRNVSTLDARFRSKFVIDDDGCWRWIAGLDRDGYGQYSVGHKKWRSHRYAYVMLKGDVPEGRVLDHTCHVRACVNPEHLRPVTYKQNAENRRGAPRGSKTGIRGVHWVPSKQRWIANVKHNDRRYYGGTFEDLEDAKAAAIALRNQLYTHNDVDRQAV